MSETWKQFQANAAGRADRLEAEAAATRLVAQADDPVDGFCVLSDLAQIHLNAGVARRGGTTAAPLVPASRLLAGFMRSLEEKSTAIAAALTFEERERLIGVASGFFASVQTADRDVMGAVVSLLPLPPDIIALWVRANLDLIERRFAS